MFSYVQQPEVRRCASTGPYGAIGAIILSVPKGLEFWTPLLAQSTHARGRH
mgnify:CR=1 FL=1